jgi:hypothetical protein
MLRSNRCGQLVERGREPQMLMAGFNAEFVVAAAHILDERVTSDHDRRTSIGTVALIDRRARPIGEVLDDCSDHGGELIEGCRDA